MKLGKPILTKAKSVKKTISKYIKHENSWIYFIDSKEQGRSYFEIFFWNLELFSNKHSKWSIITEFFLTQLFGKIFAVSIKFVSYSKQGLDLPLRSKKAGRFEKLLGFARTHFIVTLSEPFVRHHTTPFLLFSILTIHYVT